MKKVLADALTARGYTTLTPVQEAVTDPALSGHDLLVSAQTGSGKTLGFGLAIAPTLFGDAEMLPFASAPLALVIAPTRELAMQVKRELAWLYADAGAVLASCVGGMDMREERRALGQGTHIVVATPGRLRDHIMRKSIDLSNLRAVVMDEADEMLDLGFREDLEFILSESPSDRQTLMFSATVPASIATLAKKYQRDAKRIQTKSESSQHADIDYRAMNVAERDIDNAIINTLRFYEAPNAIVFCNTRIMVSRLTTRLSNRGFSVVALSGELSQAERTHALQAMRDGRARVCVATDVAARGIDLPNLDLVVHAELPSNHETLLHRSGRTGRAGRKGVSTLIVPQKAARKAERILALAKVRATWSGAPTADMVRERDEERMLSDPMWLEPVVEAEEAMVGKLVARFAPEQLAVAYLRLHEAKHSAPEELADPGEKPAPRTAFGPSVWFSIAGGRAAGAEPRRILPMLCKAGGLTRDDVGAIRMQQDETFVQVLERSVATFVRELGTDMSLEGAKVTRMNKAPAGYEDRNAGARAGGERESAPRKEYKPRDADAAPRAPRAQAPVQAAQAPIVHPPVAAREAEPQAAEHEAPRRDKLTYDPDAASARRKERDPNKPKGPPPPTGKPNSKKNKVRAKLTTRAGRKAAKVAGPPTTRKG
ncbi:MAG: DEAD/DEAH box helicase [Deltaproteobacteria bacterium]